MGGTIGTNNTTNPEFYITNTNSSSYVIARNINNFSNNNLFATQANVPINYPSSNSVYKVATQGGRLAINIPFVGNANAWEITIYADTLPGGSPSYGRAVTLLVAQETIYDSSALKTRLYANPILQSPDSAYPPSIAYQLDLQSVGTGTEIAAVTYGYAVISIPSSYTNYTFNVRQL